jgi:endonuclease/exonuclease/phosphatase family metal-dependent hydrolase
MATAGGQVPTTRGTRYGNAVLSRWAIDLWQPVALPHVPPPSWSGLGGDAIGADALFVRTDRLDVCCVHLAPDPALGWLRERQVRALDTALRELREPSSPLPAVVAGDFNADPDSNEIRFMSGLCSLDGTSTYFQDAWRVAGDGEGFTLDHTNPFHAAMHLPRRRVDYVFVGDNFLYNEFAGGPGGGTGKVLRASLLGCAPMDGVFLSDHFGLLVDIAWPNRNGPNAAR